MSRYEVDSALVAQAGGAAAASVTAIRTEVGALLRHLTDLQGAWRGAAAAAFADVVTDWSATQQQVEDGLDRIQQALAGAARTYADAEAQASRLFGA